MTTGIMIYYHVMEENLGKYTWQGQPLFNRGGQQTQGFSTQAQTANMARPRDLDFNASTPRYKEPWQEMLDDLNLHPKPMEKECHGGMGSTGGHTNPYWDPRTPHVGESGGMFPKMGASKPLEPGRDPRDRFDQSRGKRDNKKVRPTSLQKFCKKFDGIGDPYDHVAQCRQQSLQKECLPCTQWCKDLG